MDDRVIMKLSDSLPGADKGDIEVKVTAVNINSGHNSEIMKASKTHAYHLRSVVSENFSYL